MQAGEWVGLHDHRDLRLGLLFSSRLSSYFTSSPCSKLSATIQPANGSELLFDYTDNAQPITV